MIPQELHVELFSYAGTMLASNGTFPRPTVLLLLNLCFKLIDIESVLGRVNISFRSFNFNFILKQKGPGN